MYSYVLIFIIELENKIDETCLLKKRLELFLLFKPYFELKQLDKVKTIYNAQWSQFLYLNGNSGIEFTDQLLEELFLRLEKEFKDIYIL